MERKLVTLRAIDDLRPIEGADLIELAIIDGWQVVVKKNTFKVHDKCIYFEIDSFLPVEPRYEFLRKNCYRNVKGLGEGFRIKSIRLRKELSQGLVLPLSDFDIYKESDTTWKYTNSSGNQYYIDPKGEQDLSGMFGVIKYDPPVPACLSGLSRGNFPSQIRKTDQERCLSGDSVVSTSSGYVCIKEIVDKKLKLDVYTFNHNINSIELKPIIGWRSMTRRDDWVKITLKSGKNIVCTNNHMIWCDDIKSYRRADNIHIGQKFITNTDSESVFVINNSIINKGDPDDTMSNMSCSIENSERI